jgi:hypothetical protein
MTSTRLVISRPCYKNKNKRFKKTKKQKNKGIKRDEVELLEQFNNFGNIWNSSTEMSIFDFKRGRKSTSFG